MATQTSANNINRCRAQIFALAGKVFDGDKNEELHNMIAGLTGKASVKEMSLNDFAIVINALEKHCKSLGVSPRAKTKKKKNVPASSKSKQALIGKAWRLMYLIIACDENPDKSTAGVRMCAVIKKVAKIDASAKDPFNWLNMSQISKVVEALKAVLSKAELEHERRRIENKARGVLCE